MKLCDCTELEPQNTAPAGFGKKIEGERTMTTTTMPRNHHIKAAIWPRHHGPRRVISPVPGLSASCTTRRPDACRIGVRRSEIERWFGNDLKQGTAQNLPFCVSCFFNHFANPAYSIALIARSELAWAFSFVGQGSACQCRKKQVWRNEAAVAVGGLTQRT